MNKADSQPSSVTFYRSKRAGIDQRQDQPALVLNRKSVQNMQISKLLVRVELTHIRSAVFYQLAHLVSKFSKCQQLLINALVNLVRDGRYLPLHKSTNSTGSLRAECRIDFTAWQKYLYLLEDDKRAAGSSIEWTLALCRFFTWRIVAVNLVERDEIIRVWSTIVLSWLSKRIRYEGYSSYFSTFGGAYSSLGEDSTEHAHNAMNTSLKQLRLAQFFDDPNAISRCKLFLSFSFIQLGQLTEARRLLWCEYKMLRKNPREITDDRLLRMSIAGLKKLQSSAGNLDELKRANANFNRVFTVEHL